jgi:membrane-bound metal-dependent hydrolase YbcI (DUF457 family)
MPFTAYHMGAGLLARAAHKHSSVIAFGVSQVLIDLEPLVRLSRGELDVHGFSHTLLGATLVMLVTIAMRPLLNRYFPLSWRDVAVGAAVGVYSHLLLDGFLHQEMGYAWFGMLSWEAVEALCVCMGVVSSIMLWRNGVIVSSWRVLKGQFR